MKRISTGHYELMVGPVKYEAIRKDIPFVHWIVTKDGIREEFPHSFGKYGAAKKAIEDNILKPTSFPVLLEEEGELVEENISTVSVIEDDYDHDHDGEFADSLPGSLETPEYTPSY